MHASFHYNKPAHYIYPKENLSGKSAIHHYLPLLKCVVKHHYQQFQKISRMICNRNLIHPSFSSFPVQAQSEYIYANVPAPLKSYLYSSTLMFHTFYLYFTTVQTYQFSCQHEPDATPVIFELIAFTPRKCILNNLLCSLDDIPIPVSFTLQFPSILILLHRKHEPYHIQVYISIAFEIRFFKIESIFFIKPYFQSFLHYYSRR